MSAQSRQFLPALPAILRFEQGRIFHSGVNMIRIRQGRLKMPDAFKFPRVLGAVVPRMGGERFPALRRNVVGELVALPFRHSVRCRRWLAWRKARLEPGL